MKQNLLKVITYALSLTLCCIILLQSFQLSVRQKKSITKIKPKTELTANCLSFITCQSENYESVLVWIKHNLKICIETSSNSQSENEEEETKEVDTDKLCNSDYFKQIIPASKEIAIKDFLATKLPLPYLFQYSPPPEA